MPRRGAPYNVSDCDLNLVLIRTIKIYGQKNNFEKIDNFDLHHHKYGITHTHTWQKPTGRDLLL